MNNVNPALLNGVAITVIKDQYCRRGHRFNEVVVLQHVQDGDEVPGVVHMVHSEDVERDDGTPVCSGDRYKKRISLAEYGKPFMDLKTPLEALKAIYDLLESESEFYMPGLLLIFFCGEQLHDSLYFKRNVLHRDISCGNLLYLEEVRPTELTNTSREHKFCFIKHLLDPT